jgi:hypothetical protein
MSKVSLEGSEKVSALDLSIGVIVQQLLQHLFMISV